MTEMSYDEDSATFGDRLSVAREAAGLSQTQLAARVGVRLKTLQNWESDRSEPRANRLQMLAGVLNVSIIWLLSGVGEGAQRPEEAPPEDAADLAAMAAELRDLRALQLQLIERMARPEKRMRGAMRG